MEEIAERLQHIEALLMNISRSNHEAMTAEEVAAYLNIDIRSLYNLMSQKAIPYYKPAAKRAFFKRSEIEAWMLSNRQATNAEIRNEADNYCATH